MHLQSGHRTEHRLRGSWNRDYREYKGERSLRLVDFVVQSHWLRVVTLLPIAWLTANLGCAWVALSAGLFRFLSGEVAYLLWVQYRWGNS